MTSDERVSAAIAKISEGVEELRRLNYRPGKDAKETYSCTFCGRANTEVDQLFAAVGVAICDGCVESFAADISELRARA